MKDKGEIAEKLTDVIMSAFRRARQESLLPPTTNWLRQQISSHLTEYAEGLEKENAALRQEVKDHAEWAKKMLADPDSEVYVIQAKKVADLSEKLEKVKAAILSYDNYQTSRKTNDLIVARYMKEAGVSLTDAGFQVERMQGALLAQAEKLLAEAASLIADEPKGDETK